jgi:hypothetical protein
VSEHNGEKRYVVVFVSSEERGYSGFEDCSERSIDLRSSTCSNESFSTLRLDVVGDYVSPS